jgi:hypothetical protein
MSCKVFEIYLELTVGMYLRTMRKRSEGLLA